MSSNQILMRKIVSFFLSIIFIVTFSSCEKRSHEHNGNNGLWFYREFEEGDVPEKINLLEKGNVVFSIDDRSTILSISHVLRYPTMSLEDENTLGKMKYNLMLEAVFSDGRRDLFECSLVLFKDRVNLFLYFEEPGFMAGSLCVRLDDLLPDLLSNEFWEKIEVKGDELAKWDEVRQK